METRSATAAARAQVERAWELVRDAQKWNEYNTYDVNVHIPLYLSLIDQGVLTELIRQRIPDMAERGRVRYWMSFEQQSSGNCWTTNVRMTLEE